MSETDLVRAEDLDMTVVGVRRRWPQAAEYVGLDVEPCWRLADLSDCPAEGGEEARP